jgi:hypothetical protein
MGTGGDYVPPAGGTPGIATPIGQTMPSMPQTIPFGQGQGGNEHLLMLEAPTLDGVERPAAAPQTMQQPAAPKGGFGLSESYANAAAQLSARKKDAEERAALGAKLELNPQIATAEQNAKYIQEGFQALPQQKRALDRAESSQRNVGRIISDVKTSAEKPFTTGFTGSIAQYVAGTEGADLKRNLDTLLANSAFGTLQQMRMESPTGGALGAVSERELDLLQNSFTNLMNSQSKEQFTRNLAAFEQESNRAIQAARDAYAQDYQRFGGNRDQVLPAPGQQPTMPSRPAAQSLPQIQNTLKGMGRGQIINGLRAKGFSEEKINQFLQKGGL